MFVVFALLFHSIKSFCPTRTKELIRNKNYRRQKTNLIPKTVFLRNKMIFVPKPICISTMVVRKVVYGKITVNFVRWRMFYKITTMEICMQKSYDFYFILFIFRKLQIFTLYKLDLQSSISYSTRPTDVKQHTGKPVTLFQSLNLSVSHTFHVI